MFRDRESIRRIGALEDKLQSIESRLNNKLVGQLFRSQIVFGVPNSFGINNFIYTTPKKGSNNYWINVYEKDIQDTCPDGSIKVNNTWYKKEYFISLEDLFSERKKAVEDKFKE